MAATVELVGGRYDGSCFELAESPLFIRMPFQTTVVAKGRKSKEPRHELLYQLRGGPPRDGRLVYVFVKYE